MNAVVIGCGVSGLSSGIRLLESGIDTEIWTREPAVETTSNVAAAFWYPYKVYPEDLVLNWAAATYTELVKLAAIADTGVVVRELLEMFPGSAAQPWWRKIVDDFQRFIAAQLPTGYYDGYLFACPVAEMPIYLAYLQRRFEDLGGTVRIRTVDSVTELLNDHDVIVNCTGIGARELVGDQTMIPIRGQVVRVSQVGIERILLDQHGAAGLTYIVPRSRDCVLGGTAEPNDESLVPNEQTAAGILTRCIQLEPRLANAVVLEHQVGLRPGRPGIRLEVDRNVTHGRLIHNYGHGGAGVALSWGCADEVARLATAA
ncbi:MAG: FAD-binding oxidoreductase [Acidimicrobiales bacterium]|nr:MAG: FAD-binding oxidoreductase [Acidimicrobiales bacterium]